MKIKGNGYFNGDGASFWEDGKVLEVCGGDSYSTA